ncbi:hypothetical protein ACFLT1_09815 [Bacteroidota bacterium]
MLKIILAAFILLLLAVAGLGIRMLFDRKAEFRGGSCQSTAAAGSVNTSDFSCACSGACENEK